MDINRILQLAPLLVMKSFFLFGPRATGKTTLIRQQLAEKATKKISSNDLKGLKYLKEEEVFRNFVLVSQDPVSTLTDNILTIPWQKFLSDLWEDKFV
jgi:predicted AAA+ superfamily ATPase